MIVLFNVKITDTRIGYPYARASWWPKYNRFDIFKYCIASHAVLEPVVDKFVFCVDLSEYSDRSDELYAYMKSVIPESKLVVKWHRANVTQDWRSLCDELITNDNDLIWYSGNDDHIFIDSNLDMVSAGIDALKSDPDPMALMYYSHWTSQMRMSVLLGGTLTPDQNFIKYRWHNMDSIQLMKASRFKHIWFDHNFGDNLVYRTDLLHDAVNIPSTIYAPLKELVRHYDGDSHVGNLANLYPPLVIMPGFLTDTMQIRIGYQDHKADWVNLNSAAEWLYAAQPHGVDHRWCEEDIPLFWRTRMTELDIAPEYDRNIMNQARDAAYLVGSRLPLNTFGHQFTHTNAAPREWFSKHLLAK